MLNSHGMALPKGPTMSISKLHTGLCSILILLNMITLQQTRVEASMASPNHLTNLLTTLT